MFQNNGAPSSQHYGGTISCNGSTMTFSPFYMGNHTKPWEINDDNILKLDEDYPRPIVNHEKARSKALEAFKKI